MWPFNRTKQQRAKADALLSQAEVAFAENISDLDTVGLMVAYGRFAQRQNEFGWPDRVRYVWKLVGLMHGARQRIREGEKLQAEASVLMKTFGGGATSKPNGDGTFTHTFTFLPSSDEGLSEQMMVTLMRRAVGRHDVPQDDVEWPEELSETDVAS